MGDLSVLDQQFVLIVLKFLLEYHLAKLELAFNNDVDEGGRVAFFDHDLVSLVVANLDVIPDLYQYPLRQVAQLEHVSHES